MGKKRDLAQLARKAKRLRVAGDAITWCIEEMPVDEGQIKVLTAVGSGWCVHETIHEDEGGWWSISHQPTGLKLAVYQVFMQAAIVCATLAATRPLPEANVQFTPDDDLGIYLRSLVATAAKMTPEMMLEFAHHLLSVGALPLMVVIPDGVPS